MKFFPVRVRVRSKGKGKEVAGGGRGLVKVFRKKKFTS